MTRMVAYSPIFVLALAWTARANGQPAAPTCADWRALTTEAFNACDQGVQGKLEALAEQCGKDKQEDLVRLKMALVHCKLEGPAAVPETSNPKRGAAESGDSHATGSRSRGHKKKETTRGENKRPEYPRREPTPAKRPRSSQQEGSADDDGDRGPAARGQDPTSQVAAPTDGTGADSGETLGHAPGAPTKCDKECLKTIKVAAWFAYVMASDEREAERETARKALTDQIGLPTDATTRLQRKFGAPFLRLLISLPQTMADAWSRRALSSALERSIDPLSGEGGLPDLDDQQKAFLATVLDLVHKDADVREIMRMIEQAEIENQRAFFSATESLMEEQEILRAASASTRRARELLVAAAPEERAQTTHFVNAMLRGFTNQPHRERGPWVSPAGDSLGEQMKKLVSERRERCTSDAVEAEVRRPDEPIPPGCGLVLGLQLRPSGIADKPVTGVAYLRFITESGVVPVKLRIPALATGKAHQVAAAENLAERLQMRIATFHNATSGPVAPSHKCGITARLERVGSRLEGKGIELLGSCDARFDAVLLDELRAEPDLFGEVSRATRHSQPDAGLQIEGPGTGRVKRCSLRLARDPGRPLHEAAPGYAIKLFVDEEADCARSLSEDVLWVRAGLEASRYLRDYYLADERTETASWTEIFLLPGWTWARGDGSKAVVGHIWAVADLVLLVGGVSLVALSIHEQNKAVSGNGSFGAAEDLQRGGFGMLGGFVLERIAWAIFQ